MAQAFKLKGPEQAFPSLSAKHQSQAREMCISPGKFNGFLDKEERHDLHLSHKRLNLSLSSISLFLAAD